MEEKQNTQQPTEGSSGQIEFTDEHRKKILQIFFHAAKTYFNNDNDQGSNSGTYEALKNLFDEEKFLSAICYNPDMNKVVFSADNEEKPNYEDKLFDTLLGTTPKKVCKYISLESLIKILDKGQFKLLGLVGMNDRTEHVYVDNYYEEKCSKKHKKNCIVPGYGQVESINEKFIVSCSKDDKIDNLTLWRLYGNNAKGACLVFKIRESINFYKNMFLNKISYQDNNNNDKILDFLQKVVEKIDKKLPFKFELQRLSYWKHFFKPKEYAPESEVRLLVVGRGQSEKKAKSPTNPNREWTLTDKDSILTPVIEFNLADNSFPLELVQIILGPNCPEKDVNKKQIEDMLKSKYQKCFLSTTPVTISEITSYR